MSHPKPKLARLVAVYFYIFYIKNNFLNIIIIYFKIKYILKIISITLSNFDRLMLKVLKNNKNFYFNNNL